MQCSRVVPRVTLHPLLLATLLVLASGSLAEGQTTVRASSPPENTAEAPQMESLGSLDRPYLDLGEGQAAARKQQKPLLVLFRTPDCRFTELFFQRTALDPAIRSAVDSLVFTSIDVAEGQGRIVGRMHEVAATPTFVVYDAERGPLHQWRGWGPEAFLDNLTAALRSNTPVVDRMDRYAAEPTSEDARLLGFFYASTGKFDLALDAFTTAARLQPEQDLSAEIFDAAASGHSQGTVDIAALTAAADVHLAKATTIEEKINIAAIVANATERAGTGPHAAPYLRAAFEDAQGTTSVEVQQALDRLEPYRLLYVEQDPAAALARYQSRYPGWPNEPDALNDVAWFAMAHRIALAAAEGWAREAIAKYDEPLARANARDTLADILLLLNRTDEAIGELETAVEEAPSVAKYGERLAALGVAPAARPTQPKVTIRDVGDPAGNDPREDDERSDPQGDGAPGDPQ